MRMNRLWVLGVAMCALPAFGTRPSDPMFDTMAGNPCRGQGKGIMPEIKAAAQIIGVQLTAMSKM
jgi:hypothetical protein